MDSLKQDKPGWMSRLFEIEVGTLVACDATNEDRGWSRGSSFNFLYRGRRGHYFLLMSPHDWKIVDEADAERLFAELPVKLFATLSELPAPELAEVPEDDDDRTRYRVVRNDAWYFSILPEHLDLPAGWKEIEVEGTKRECLQYIEKNCVFGAPNPSMA